MILKLKQTFFPSEEIGVQGDKIKICIKPCCEMCITRLQDFIHAIQKIHICVQNNKGKYITVFLLNNFYKIFDKKSTKFTENGDFIYIIDYADILPHPPDSPLFITVILDLPICIKYTQVLKSIPFPFGVDNIVKNYCNFETSMSIESKPKFMSLNSARFHLNTIQCCA
jgi:hypothetical protein